MQMQSKTEKKVILFGSTGMMGNYVRYVLNHHDLYIINRNQFDANNDSFEKLSELVKNLEPNENTTFINCIGAIPQKDYDAHMYKNINQEFPHIINKIRKEYNAKFIHITTDCVFSGKDGNYNEQSIHDADTVYGQTKSRGEPSDCAVIRTSIIGEDNLNKKSLLEWVISKKNNTIDGYTNHLWNGVTCYQLALIIDKMVNENIYWEGVRHIFSPNIVSKYELCQDISQVYCLNINVEKKETEKCNRTLTSVYEKLFIIPSIHDQLVAQKGKIRKIVTITGIRPDFIRMSEIFKKLDKNFDHILIHTGQHYDKTLSDVFFEELDIRKPDYTLSCGKESKTHYEQTSYLFREVPKLLKEIDPYMVIFLGDANTAMVSSVLKKEGYRIGHIEAGMRSYDKRMLEEINRTICDHCSDILFVYHDDYKEQLAKENIKQNVYVVGNTVVEPCKLVMDDIMKNPKRNDMILIDIHRPENFKYPERMRDIIKFANMFYDHYKLPMKMLEFFGTSKFIKENNIDLGNIQMVPLMSFKQYLNTVYHCKFIISDSGTGQEEPALLFTPVLVPRDYSERPQSYLHNCSRQLSLNKMQDSVYLEETYTWIEKFKDICDPSWLGDGKTSERIIGHIKEFVV
jgi:UDP-N-acetylglucosamine 2-epimerase (non-hydrolysing)